MLIVFSSDSDGGCPALSLMNAICAIRTVFHGNRASFQFFHRRLFIVHRYQIIKLENEKGGYLVILSSIEQETQARKLTRCSNAMCEFGGSPTQALKIFSMAVR